MRSFVEVDAASRDGAVEVVELDRLFEDVDVVVFVSAGWIGARNVKEVAKLGEEERVVGTLCCFGLQPARYEVLRRRRHRCVHVTTSEAFAVADYGAEK